MILISFLCSFFFQYRFLEVGQHEPTHPHALILKSQVPISIEGKLVNFSNSTKIYYWQELMIYELSVYDRGVQTEPLHFGVEDLLKQYPVIHEYFVYRKDAAYGYWFNSFRDNKRRRTRVDSFLHEYAFKGIGIYKTVYENASIETIQMPGYQKVEQIVPWVKKDETYADTVYLYYQNKKDFKPNDYSLSEQLDSASGAKLVKSRFIYNAQTVKKDSTVIPANEMWFEIKRVPIPNDTALYSFFEKTRKQLTD